MCSSGFFYFWNKNWVKLDYNFTCYNFCKYLRLLVIESRLWFGNSFTRNNRFEEKHIREGFSLFDGSLFIEDKLTDYFLERNKLLNFLFVFINEFSSILFTNRLLDIFILSSAFISSNTVWYLSSDFFIDTFFKMNKFSIF